MAKKKSHRKHNFKHKAPARVETQVKRQAGPQLTAAPTKAPAVKRRGNGSTDLEAELGPGMIYVKQDVRRVGVLAAAFVGLQLILWFLFEHTGLGAAVYHLVKL